MSLIKFTQEQIRDSNRVTVLENGVIIYNVIETDANIKAITDSSLYSTFPIYAFATDTRREYTGTDNSGTILWAETTITIEGAELLEEVANKTTLETTYLLGFPSGNTTSYVGKYVSVTDATGLKNANTGTATFSISTQAVYKIVSGTSADTETQIEYVQKTKESSGGSSLTELTQGSKTISLTAADIEYIYNGTDPIEIQLVDATVDKTIKINNTLSGLITLKDALNVEIDLKTLDLGAVEVSVTQPLTSDMVIQYTNSSSKFLLN